MSNATTRRLTPLLAALAAACTAAPNATAPRPHTSATASTRSWLEPASTHATDRTLEAPARDRFADPAFAPAPAFGSALTLDEVYELDGHAEAEEHEPADRGTQVADLFLGGTDELRNRDGYTVGLDYGYHLAEDWGFGAFAEFVSGSRRSFAAGVMAFYHPVEPWFIGTGPGMERSENEWEPIWRLATSWEVHIHEGLFIAPTLAYDWNTHDDVVVYGLSIGIVR